MTNGETNLHRRFELTITIEICTHITCFRIKRTGFILTETVHLIYLRVIYNIVTYQITSALYSVRYEGKKKKRKRGKKNSSSLNYLHREIENIRISFRVTSTVALSQWAPRNVLERSK